MLVGLFARAKDAGCRLTMHVFKGLISVQWIIRRDVGSGRDSGRGWLSAWDRACGFRGDRLRHNLSSMSVHSRGGSVHGHPELSVSI